MRSRLLLALLAFSIALPSFAASEEPVAEEEVVEEFNLSSLPSMPIVALDAFGGRGFDTPLALEPDGEGGALALFEADGYFMLGPSDVNSKIAPMNVARWGSDFKWVWSEKIKRIVKDSSLPVAMCSSGGRVWYGGSETARKNGDVEYCDIFLQSLDMKKHDVSSDRIGGPLDDRITAMTSDGAEGCWIAGSIGGQCTEGAWKFKGDEFQPFIGKVSGKAELKEVYAISATGALEVEDMTPDGEGGCWMVGVFEGAASFGKTMLTPGEGRSRGIFLAHLSAKGEWRNVQRLSCGDDCEVKYISWSPSRKIGAIGGTFSTMVIFGDREGYSSSGSSAFAAIFDERGSWKELNVFQPDNYSSCGGVLIDGKSGIWFGLNYNAGEGIRNPKFHPKTALLHLTDDLSPDSAVREIESEAATIRDLAARNGTGCYLIGMFRESIAVKGRKAESVGEYDIFIAAASSE
ncbi:MAG: hypothetical protein Kow00107_07860 [Planctomycetota bacterium]